MCDLWIRTTEETVPVGAIPGQIRAALEDLGTAAERVKLYNAGSFFDPRAIPAEDHAAIAEACAPFERVIVESHPALAAAAPAFAARLTGDLEVAMGLETIHPEILPLLQKNMTAADFRRAAEALASADVAVRAFVLVGLPYLERAESVDWAVRSVEFAIGSGAGAVSLVPTRTGNGAMDALAARGSFEPPRLSDLERAFAASLDFAAGRARVFADLWDADRLRVSACARCFTPRVERLARMNLDQRATPAVACGCEDA
jgi:radical SAM enzyme (TIGR01210 family)